MIKQSSVKEQKILEAYTLSISQRDGVEANQILGQEEESLDENITSIQKLPSVTEANHQPQNSSTPHKVTPKRQTTSSIFYSGVLAKKSSSSWFSSWTKRYCTINQSKFSYHQSSDPSSPEIGLLNFNAVCVQLFLQFTSQNQISAIRIIPKGTDKQFIFRSQDQNLNYKWAKLFQESIKNSEGLRKGYTQICREPEFWKRHYEMEREFRKNVESGDIILFKGANTKASLLRRFMFSDYDHVGVLLKNQRDEVIIFEATGGVGVGILPWKKFIQRGWHKTQQIVSYRKLFINRTSRFYQSVEKFVNDNIGKNYNFSISKMLKRFSVLEETEGIPSKVGKSSYFCSELVAALFKHLGILEKAKSSTQYWPGSFEEDEELRFIESKEFGEASLGRETIIVFEEGELKLEY